MVLNRRAARWAVLLVFLAGCLFIAWNVPYTQDDWGWGTPTGVERWLSGELNNRYVGTFFVLVMTRSRLLKALIMGGAMFLLPLLSAALASREREEGRLPLALLAGAALFSVPMVTWRQTFGWVSAFANFVLGGVFTLVALLLWRRAVKPSDGSRGWEPFLLAAALFPLCAAAQLFVENLTVILAGLALLGAGYALAVRRGRLPALSALAGCALGALIMFHNPLYGQLLAEGHAVEGIRSLVFPVGAGLGEILSIVVPRYLLQVLPGMFQYFPGVCALLAAGSVRQLLRRGAPRWAAGLIGLWMAGYSLCSLILMEYQRRNLGWGRPEVWAAATVVQLVLLLAVVIWAAGPERWPRLLLVLSAAGLLLPFAALYDSGPRCAFLSGLALLTAALSLLDGLVWPRWAQGGACLLLAAAVGYHVYAYDYIGRNDAVRLEQMARAAAEGADSVILPTERLDRYYFWGRNPGTYLEIWGVEYRAFFGLPEDMELIFLPYGSADLWPDIPPEMLEQAQRLP